MIDDLGPIEHGRHVQQAVAGAATADIGAADKATLVSKVFQCRIGAEVCRVEESSVAKLASGICEEEADARRSVVHRPAGVGQPAGFVIALHDRYPIDTSVLHDRLVAHSVRNLAHRGGNFFMRYDATRNREWWRNLGSRLATAQNRRHSEAHDVQLNLEIFLTQFVNSSK